MRGLVLGLLAATLAGGGLCAEDDLDVIRRALSADARSGSALGRDAATATTRDATLAVKKGEPQWLRVRVTGKGEKKQRVSVNLPLAFVKAVGGDWPLHFGRACHREQEAHYCSIKLSEVLRSLDAGQDIVELDDEQQTVRVWVE
jgi:hypothetical protein